MSKMAEMDQTIQELRDAAAAINNAADWLISSSLEPRMILQSNQRCTETGEERTEARRCPCCTGGQVPCRIYRRGSRSA
jgi:hypothetical protein